MAQKKNIEYKSVFLPSEVYDRLKNLAQSEKRAMGRQIEVLLDSAEQK